MAGRTVQLLGSEILSASLVAASDEISTMKQGHAKAAQILETAARGFAPRGATGDLAASVFGRVGRNQAIVGASVEYAGVIEFGWPRRNIAAQPYLRRAVEETQAQWVDAYLAGAQKILNKVRGA